MLGSGPFTIPQLVIPAKAGIQGRTYRFSQVVLCKLLVQAMDSRLRGNDKG